MLLKFHIVFIFVVCAFIFVVNIGTTPTSNFGKFDLEIAKMEECAGPKRKACCIWDIHVTNKKLVHFNVTVKENLKPLKVKIVVFSNNKELARLQMNTVCENVFLKPMFQSILNLTDNCSILKGRYSYEMDVENIVRTYTNGEFLYGNITLKSVLYNNDCNFMCLVQSTRISPKKSK